MHNLMVVERIDIARRAEGMAIHVLQVGSPLTIKTADGRRENKGAQKTLTLKFY